MSDYGNGTAAATNGVDKPIENPVNEAAAAERAAARQKEFEEGIVKAKEHGWTQPLPYNYAAADAVATQQEPHWLSDAAVYEWDDEFGDVGPVNPELERELFNSDHLMRAGGAIQALSFEVTAEGATRVSPIKEFADAGLHPIMMENVRLAQYHNPTPIQMYCIPAVLTGHDVVACAQTGSGKTAAYLIPILSKLMGKAKVLAAPRPSRRSYVRDTDRVRAEPLVLIVCPTRELACQIFDDCRRLCYRSMLRPCVIYGGAAPRLQREQLEMGCDVLIATPGRLMDFMRQANLISFARLKFTVLDEADELLSDGWEDAMEKILAGSDTNEDADHTYMMFSATFPKSARKLAKQYMEEDFVKINVGRVGSTHKNIKQSIVWVDEHSKNEAVFDLVLSGGAMRTLIFVNSKRKAEMVDDYFFNKGLPSTSTHSDRTQREREDALRAFRSGECPILVATGVMARGLDVKDIAHVINYDLPSSQHGGIDEYIHRIGRTARIGNEGRATSFYNENNEDLADDLVKIFVENGQEVPDFLQDRIPETVEWDDNSDDDDEDNADGFGGSGFDSSGFGDSADSGFQAEGGFTADDSFKADDSFQAEDGFQSGGGFDAGNAGGNW